MAQILFAWPPRLVMTALLVCAAASQPIAAAELRGYPDPLILAQDDPDAQAPVDDAQSNAGLLVRITRLEDRLRAMTGQIEELQFQNKKLEDQLRKMSQDVDFRFQDLGRPPAGARPAPQKRGDAASVPDAPQTAAVTPATPGLAAAAEPAPVKTVKRSDAFDPDAAPDSPGAPKPLGTTTPSQPLTAAAAPPSHSPAMATSPAPLTTQPHAPLDLTPSSLAGGTRAAMPPAVPDRTASIDPAPDLRGTSGTGPAGGARADYDSAFALYKAAQYDAAITGFQDFLGKYPKDRLVADATYFMGESFARLGRQREAAEQFLKMSTDYNRSTRAPDALLRLGVALNALGAKEQACATYQEVDRKYPAASPDVRAGVERELKRARC